MRSCLILSALICVACTEDPLPTPTMNGPSSVPSSPPGALPDLRFSRPPPRDMDLSDAGDEGVDAAGDAAADSQVDAQASDARVDQGLPACTADPCVLAVELDRCDPCPIALPTSIVAERRCTVPFDMASPLFEYLPFSCTAACPQDALQACNAPVGAPVCGADDVCRVVL